MNRYAKEIGYCLLAVALLELVFYLATDDDFSLFIYLKSVVEVFAAPLHPGWHLVYPTAILGALLTILVVLRKIKTRVLRIVLAFTCTLAWAVLGFATIVAYYP